MTVALSDTQLLTDMLRPLHSFKNPLTTATTTSEFYTLRKPVSATINTLANALYQVEHPLQSPVQTRNPAQILKGLVSTILLADPDSTFTSSSHLAETLAPSQKGHPDCIWCSAGPSQCTDST